MASDTDRRSHIAQMLHGVRFFRNLAEQPVAELTEAAIPLRYTMGEIIFLEGAPVSGIYLVEQGIVRISRTSKEGKDHIMLLCGAGDTFNDVGALDGGPNPATATAHTDVVLWCISRPDLERIALRYPDLAWALIEDLAGRARYLLGLVEDLAMRSVRGRLARLLLEQVQASETDTVPRLMTQEEMAARLGTVREMVGRTLRSMASEGIIEFDRHRIIILDPERLAQEADV